MTSYLENEDSQQSTLDLLQQLGYTYLSVDEVNAQREGRSTRVLLKGILQTQLERLNRYDYRGQVYEFSSSTIQKAISDLANPSNDGLEQINQKTFELLLRGRGYEETVQGQKRSFTLQYIDWYNWENNVFHVTKELSVRGINNLIRADVVLYVNGIPFAIIENKRRDKANAIREAISQQQRNQDPEVGAPRLFYYSQLLLAVEPNSVYYGTTKTNTEYWSVWKEEGLKDQVRPLLQGRLPTEQDISLYALCRPERLLELTQKFIVYDGNIKKIARYQQYFAINSILERVQHTDNSGKRQGGVIWHTQGSGKSLTMVMLSKALKFDQRFPRARIVLVTDRVSLDKQISKTFRQCGIQSLEKTKSGKQLAQYIANDNIEVVTAVINKFGSGKTPSDYQNTSSNIFVLIDESHRSQYGRNHGYLKKMLPNACLIGFTGTPLNKKEKSTAQKFGGFIHQYTIDQAVKDGAVLPIIYEGRSAKFDINKKTLDERIDRVEETVPDYYTEADKANLRKKHASISALYNTLSVVEEIAEDIAKHYNKNLAKGINKAQLAVHSIDTAIKYHQYFERNKRRLKLNTAVVFSPPDARKGHDNEWTEVAFNNRQYWEKLVQEQGGQKAYEEWVTDRFKEKGTEVELIIVVDKLLTGFDAPRNTVLYLAKPLRDHNLLQAIARVNRVFEGKDYGFVIDYMGILGNLDKALTDYAELSGYEEEDLAGALLQGREVLEKVPEHYHDLWRLFEGVNQKDLTAMEEHLKPEDIRDDFYKRLTTFSRSLQTALSLDEYYTRYSEENRTNWEQDWKFFIKLKASISRRKDENFNEEEYQYRIKQLLDRYVLTEEIQQLTQPINIFNQALRAEELLKDGKTPASIADQIAHRMKRSITERLEEDPAYYKKLSDMLEDIIKAFEEGRIEDTEFLERIVAQQNELHSGNRQGIPDRLQHHPKARAFYGSMEEVLQERQPPAEFSKEALAALALAIDNSVRKIATVDWQKNSSKLSDIANCVEDHLLDKSVNLGVDFAYAEVDRIIAQSKKIAKANY